jgi:hypothetical protein
MNSLPPLGKGLRDTLIFMIVSSYCAILTHFALEPDRFSSEALYVMVSLGVVVIPVFVRILLGQTDGPLTSIFISILNLAVARKRAIPHRIGKKNQSTKKFEELSDGTLLNGSISNLNDPSNEPQHGCPETEKD